MGTADETNRRWSCCGDGRSAVVEKAVMAPSELTGIEDFDRRSMARGGMAHDL